MSSGSFWRAFAVIAGLLRHPQQHTGLPENSFMLCSRAKQAGSSHSRQKAYAVGGSWVPEIARQTLPHPPQRNAKWHRLYLDHFVERCVMRHVNRRHSKRRKRRSGTCPAIHRRKTGGNATAATASRHRCGRAGNLSACGAGCIGLCRRCRRRCPTLQRLQPHQQRLVVPQPVVLERQVLVLQQLEPLRFPANEWRNLL